MAASRVETPQSHVSLHGRLSRLEEVSSAMSGRIDSLAKAVEVIRENLQILVGQLGRPVQKIDGMADGGPRSEYSCLAVILDVQ